MEEDTLAKMSRPLPLALSLQGSIAVLTLAGIALVLFLPKARVPVLPLPKATEIGIEHTENLPLTLRVSTHDSGGLVEVENHGKHAIALSVPQAWTRREVKGATLAAVTADAPAAGFVRWALPAGAGVQFTAPGLTSSLLLHHTPDVPIAVTYTLVDLDSGRTEHDVVLFREADRVLW